MGGVLISADAKGRISFWNPETGTRTGTADVGSRILGLGTDSAQDSIYAITTDASVTKIDLQHGTKTSVFTWPTALLLPGQKLASRVSLATPARDGGFFATINPVDKEQAWIAHIEPGEPDPLILTDLAKPVTSLLAIDRSRILAGTMDMALVIDTQTHRVADSLVPRGHPFMFASWVTGLAYYPTSNTVTLASSDGIIDWIRIGEAKEFASTRTFRNGVSGLVGGRVLTDAVVVGYGDGSIGALSPDGAGPPRYWDAPVAPDTIATNPAPRGTWALQPAARTESSGSGRGWPATEDELTTSGGFRRENLDMLVAMVDMHADTGVALFSDAISPDLTIGSLDDMTHAGKSHCPANVGAGGAIWTKDGVHAWVAFDSGKIVSLDTNTGAVGAEVWSPDSPAAAMAASADRSLVAAVTEKGAIRLWKDGQSIREWQSVISPGALPQWSVVVPDDGSFVLVAAENQIELRRLGGQEPIVLSLPVGQTIFSVGISHSAEYVVVGTDDGHLQLWSLKTFAREWDRPVSGSPITGAAFLPEGTAIVTGSRDGDLGVWSRQDGTELFRRRGLPPVERLSVLGDGSIVASVMGDSKIYGKVDVILWRPPKR
jgi:WD40 repeat protein